MCERISWTIRVQPKYKQKIAIDAAKQGCTKAQLLEQIIAQHYQAKHEA